MRPLSPERSPCAEEKRLFEAVRADSGIVGGTTSGRGGQSLHKGGGQSSTKECGESSQEQMDS